MCKVTIHLDQLQKSGNYKVVMEMGKVRGNHIQFLQAHESKHWIMKWSFSFICLFALAIPQLQYIAGSK